MDHNHESGCCCCGEHEHCHEEREEKESGLRVILQIAACGILLVAAHFLGAAEIFLSAAALAAVGFDIVFEAVKNLLKGEFFDELLLMSVAAIGAFIIGEHVEAAVIMILYRVGELITDFVVDRSKASIEKLSNMRPKKAALITENGVVFVAPCEVKVGDIILVNAGEQVPLDGVVEDGFGLVDTSSLTGESLPREITGGSEIKAGYIDLNCTIRVKVTAEFENCEFADMIRIAENAAERKSRPERFIKRFAKIYTPVVVGLAFVVSVVLSIITKDVGGSIHRGLMMLVISCPCALVISIPLGYLGGIGAISKQGVLVKGGTTIDQLAKMSSLALDKTGTVTRGVFEVSEICPEPSFTREELIDLCATAEYHSHHPIAAAIKKSATSFVEPDGTTEEAGLGITAKIGNDTVLVGNEKLMATAGINVLPDGATTVFVCKNGIYAGKISVRDTLKDGVRRDIDELRGLGISEIAMLTGDGDFSAKSAADALGADFYRAACMPSDKVSAVEEMLGENKTVGFIGDGVNDAPVLARADIGIAMGRLGSDAAVESADAVIMNDKISCLAGAIRAARATRKTVIFNIAFALTVKAAFLVLASLNLIHMYFAVFADTGVTLIAVMISLSLILRKFRK